MKAGNVCPTWRIALVDFDVILAAGLISVYYLRIFMIELKMKRTTVTTVFTGCYK